MDEIISIFEIFKINLKVFLYKTEKYTKGIKNFQFYFRKMCYGNRNYIYSLKIAK